MRTPLNIIDQSVLHLDQDPEPWSVHFEVRVTGRLDAERVAAAALAATAKHPMARARLASFGYWDRRLFWELPERVEHLPLEIVDCPDDAALADARDRLLSMRVSLDSSPPFALTLAHHPGGDRLIMNLNHAAADGISAYRLMVSLARAYAGVEDPVPSVDPLAAGDPGAHTGAPGVKQRIARLRRLGDHVSELRSEGPAVRLAKRGGDEGAEGYRFHLLRFGPEETEAVLARRRQPASVNDLLLAGLAIAIANFNAERGVASGRISVMMPVSVRPPDWGEEVVANLISFVPVLVSAHEQSDLVTAQLAVHSRTRELKDRRLSGTVIDILSLTRVCPVGVRHLIARTLVGPVGDRVADTTILSNVGQLAMPLDFGEGAGAASEVWFSPPGQRPLDAGIGVASMNDEMFLTLRYRRSQFDPGGAAAFVDAWREVLLGD
jgi:NRPS condensation-like uncharacterized protein